MHGICFQRTLTELVIYNLNSVFSVNDTIIIHSVARLVHRQKN